MFHEKESNAGTAIGFFILGTLVGGSIALLFAPKPGYKLRKDIRKKTGALIDDGEKYLKEAKDKANEMIKDSLKSSEHLIDAAKKKVNSIL